MNHIGEQSDVHAGPCVSWGTYLNNGRYVELSRVEVLQFEQAIRHGHDVASYVWPYAGPDGVISYTTYYVYLEDLEEVWQCNTKTGRCRRLYRTPY